MSTWCDRARAALFIGQACQIGTTLRRLEQSLPFQSDNLEEAINSIDQATQIGPSMVRDLNNQILGVAFGIQNEVYASQQLANLPFYTASQELRDLTNDMRQLGASTVAVLDMLNCVSRILTDETIPGMSRVKACIQDAFTKIQGALNQTQQTVNEWNAAVNNAINGRLNDIQDRIGDIVQEAIDDSTVVACLSSVIDIPEEIFRNVNTSISEIEEQTAGVGQQSGGCSGLSKSLADALEYAHAEIGTALEQINEINDRAQVLLSRLPTIQNITPQQRTQVAQAMSTMVRPPVTPATVQAIQAVQTTVQQIQQQLVVTSQQAGRPQNAFMFGHEVLLSRTTDTIRITHRNGSSILFDPAGNIHLRPNGVVFSKLPIVPIVV